LQQKLVIHYQMQFKCKHIFAKKSGLIEKNMMIFVRKTERHG